MRTSKLDYKLPPDLIAKHPAKPRDAARLLVLDKKKKKITESNFREIGEFLMSGDVLVFNQSKVFPARCHAKTESGKEVEVFFLSPLNANLWEVLIGGRVKDNEKLNFGHGLWAEVTKGKVSKIRVNKTKEKVFDFLEKYGEVPLPPYIKRKASNKDRTEYQNVFAKVTGSAAAPTAGMHFTKSLLENLKKRGIEIEFVTLHVGLGTFAPIKVDKVEDHNIHTEIFEISGKTKERLKRARQEGRRVIACGTTSLRVLESIELDGKSESGQTDIFIYPGHSFKNVDGLITNFHTPRSSLLALVWAFGGKFFMKKAYRLAIKKRYRFFSYGDGMLIFRD